MRLISECGLYSNAAYILLKHHFNDLGPFDIFNAFEKWGPLTSLSYVIDGANIRLNKKDSHCGQIPIFVQKLDFA